MAGIWRESTVGEFVERGEAEIKTGPFGTQLRASDYVESGTPVINVRNIGFGSIRPEKLEYIDEDTVQRLSSHLLKPGDIVFGRKGAVERHVLIRENQDRWFQGSDCIRLRIKSCDIDSEFLSYLFLTQDHQRWMQNQGSHGATMASLNQDIINRIPLRLPPLETQRQIADILSAYDDLIENNTRRIQILEEMARTIYREWFVHFRYPGHSSTPLVDSPIGPAPEGWEVGTVADVADYIARGIRPKYDDESESLVINQRCIRDHKLDLSNARRHSANVSDPKYARFGDILINSTGVGTLGRVAQVREELDDCTVDSHVTIVRPMPTIDMDFFGATLLELEPYFEAQGAGATGQTELRRDRIGEGQLVIPIEPLQRSFGTVARPIYDQISLLLDRNDTLSATRELLLPRLISGQIDTASAPAIPVEVGP